MTKLDSILANTTTPITARVSPGIHPDSLLPFGPTLAADDSPLTAEAFNSARLALKSLYESMNAIEIADTETRAQHASGVVVDGANVRPAISPERAAELAASMGQRWETTARVFDQHLKRVTETQESLAQAIEKALQNPKKNEASAAQAASDIRRYVAALPDGQRMDFLHKAIESGDHEIASAILGTSGFVSGLNREQAATIRDMASQKFAPRQYEQHRALSAVQDALTNAAKNWSARFDQLLPRVVESSHEKALKALKAGA